MCWGRRRIERWSTQAVLPLLFLFSAFVQHARAQEDNGSGEGSPESRVATVEDLERAIEMLEQANVRPFDRLEKRWKQPSKAKEARHREIAEQLVSKHESRMELKGHLQSLATGDFLRIRNSALRACVEWLRGGDRYEGDREVSQKCVRILGELRAPEAVPSVIKTIESRAAETDPTKEATLRERYPACDALVRIGKPSVHAAVEGLKDEAPESEKAGLYVLVILGVEGADVGRFVLQRAADVETDPRKRANLRAAIERLKGREPGTKAIPKRSVHRP